MFLELLSTPGEHPFTFQGQVGTLEGICTIPEKLAGDKVAILGHPHSLHGGSMQNKVITTLARTFKEAGIPSLRFNFRGVGLSQGSYDAGIGESEDMLMLTRLWLKEMPQAKVIYAGFSFGSYVAYRAAVQQDSIVLISVAPAVHHYDYKEFSQKPKNWVIIQGEIDEVVPPKLVYDFAKTLKPSLKVIRIPEATHFFHGKLLILREKLMDIIQGLP